MKKVFIFLLSLFVISTVSAQKLVTNEIDKFTKKETKLTSEESLYSVNFMASGFVYKFDFRIQKVDKKYAILAHILMDDIVKYDEDSGVTFLLDNDETLFLRTAYTGVGGDAFAQGYYFKTAFDLSDENVEKLKNHKITDVRVTYMDGYYDRELKSKKQGLIMKMLKLFE